MKSRLAGILPICLYLLFVPFASYSQSATSLYAEGNKALREDRFYQAIESFRSAIEVNPRYLEPLVGMAASYFALAEFEEALTYVEQAGALDRENTRITSLEGRIRIGLAQFEEARALFEGILLSEPNSIDAQFGIAELEIADGKNANAAALYEQALTISPYNRRALLSLILIFDEAGNHEVAARYLEQVLDYHPENAQVQYIAAKHLLQSAEYQDAEYHALIALDLNPDYLDATLLLSQVYLVQKQYEKAISILLGVLAIHRDESMMWYNLGVASALSGRKDEAIQAYARAFTIKPDDELSRIALENLLIATTEIGNKLRERFARYHFERGRDLMDRNYLDRAIQEFRRGLILTPRARDGRLLYASVYQLLGLEGKYLSELRVIRDLGFDDREITDRIEISESLQRDALSVRWDISQYDLDRYRHTLMVFYRENDLLHFLGERDLADYFTHLLLRYDTVDVISSPARVMNFGEAYREARTGAADFFLVLNTDEGSRHFALGWKLYSGSTGALLADFAVLRTGNDRVVSALRKAADDAFRRLPFYAEILERDFDTVLIDAGSASGLTVDDELLILRRETLARGQDTLEIQYAGEDILGVLKITGIDELVAEGVIEKDPFFDLINLGDRVIYAHEDGVTDDLVTQPLPSDLYRTILKIR